MKNSSLIILALICFMLINPVNIMAQTIEFSISEQTLGNTRVFGIVIADIDMDSDNDVLMANYIGPSQLWINDGLGSFTQNTNTFSPALLSTDEAHDVDIADLNGDSLPDIFIANMGVSNKVYFNNGSGQYIWSGHNIGNVGDNPGTVQLSDVDSDGDQDVLIYNYSAPNRIWINNGAGSFTITDVDYGGDGCNGIILSDLNGDTYPDLYISMRNEPNKLRLNDGSGSFSDSGQVFGSKAEDIACKDIDNDGDVDILIVGSNGVAAWLNQNNTGIFVEGFSHSDPAFGCILVDVDLDGDEDLITTQNNESGNKLWINDGQGTFTSQGNIFGNIRTLSLASGKLDADEDFDVILGRLEGTGGNTIYFNESKAVGINNENRTEISAFELFCNYPNPFNPITNIHYEIPESQYVKIQIYDMEGYLITTIVDKFNEAGAYNVKWDASECSSGIYIYSLEAGNRSISKKMLLIK